MSNPNIAFTGVVKGGGNTVSITSPLESNGAIPVNIQDQTSEVIDLYMCKEVNNTNPASAVDIDAKTVNVIDATGAVVGGCIDIKEDGHVFQAVILTIVGTTITFNAPSDKEFTTAATVIFGNWNMNVDGSVTPITYRVKPPAGVKWDIVRVIFSIGDDASMDSTTFGGLPSLDNGLVLRVKNGVTKNIFVVNNNGGFAERAYDVSYDDRRSPLGEYGFRCRRTFGGQNKNGVVIRLDGDTDDELQVIIQDDLTDLTKLAVVCQGHTTTD